jgi:membrane-associated HD superfamily phosphohydrolase
MISSRENPYNNRDFLMIFNGVLLAVMAIIFFSVAESTRGNKSYAQTVILFLLSVVTIVVNCVALSAIVLRISEWGFSPNRSAVLGGNILILINLLLVAVQLFKAVFKKGEVSNVGKTIAFYLPVYFVWVVIVTFLFPLVFGFR